MGDPTNFFKAVTLSSEIVKGEAPIGSSGEYQDLVVPRSRSESSVAVRFPGRPNSAELQVDKLIKSLKTGDGTYEEKNEIVQNAIQQANPDSLHSYCRILSDKDLNENVRFTTADALAAIADGSASGGKFDDVYRSFVGVINDPQESPDIKNCLLAHFQNSGMPEFARSAVEKSLEGIVRGRDIAYGQNWDEAAKGTYRVRACSALGSRAAASAEDVLLDPCESYGLKNQIVLALAENGDVRAAGALVEVLSKEVGNSFAPTKSLNRSGESLKESESARDPFLSNVVAALRELNPNGITVPLEEIYQKSSGKLRNELALALPQLASEKGDPALINRLLNDPSIEQQKRKELIDETTKWVSRDQDLTLLRENSAKEFTEGFIKNSPVATPAYLTRLLEDKNPLAGSVAQQALKKIVHDGISIGTQRFQETVFQALQEFPQHEAKSDLLKYLKPGHQNSSINIDNSALQALEKIDAPRATHCAEKLLDRSPAGHSPWKAAQGALEFLLTRNPNVVANYLEKANGDTEHFTPDDHAMMAGMMARLDPERFRSAILATVTQNTALADGIQDALNVLAKDPDEKVKSSLESMLDRELWPNLRLAVSRCLLDLGSERAEKELFTLVNGKIQDDSQEALKALLEHHSPEVARTIVEGLFDQDFAASSAFRQKLGEAWACCADRKDVIAAIESWGESTATKRSDGDKIKKYLTALQLSSEQGLDYPFRFDPDTLIHSTTLRAQDEANSKSTFGNREALVVLTKKDTVGAFTDIGNSLRSLLDHGYNVRIYEAGSDAELGAVLRGAGERGGVDFIAIGGHGARNELGLGQDGSDRLYPASDDAPNFDIGDIEELKNVGAGMALRPGGKVALLSCYTGSGESTSQNLANGVRQLFPQAAVGGIIAPTSGTGQETITFDSSGRVDTVQFDVDGYYARLNVPAAEKDKALA